MRPLPERTEAGPGLAARLDLLASWLLPLTASDPALLRGGDAPFHGLDVIQGQLALVGVVAAALEPRIKNRRNRVMLSTG